MDLRIKNLTVKYEDVIVKDLNLTVLNGEFCTIIGHSGTGKSTILKAISGLIPLETGQIFLNNVEVTDVPTAKREVGFVFQKPLLFPHLTVHENISFGLQIRHWSKKEIESRVKELLELLEIEFLDNRYPHELSGGQQQRVAIARTLAPNPKIILMDEPFSSLDPRLREHLGNVLKDIQIRLGLTIVFVTHDPLEALKLSDKVAFLNNLEIVQYAHPNEVYYKPRQKVVGDFFGKGNWFKGECRDRIFKNNIFEFKTTLDNGQYKMFIRPHQIDVVKGSKWIITDVKLIGKDCLLTLQCKDYILNVELRDTRNFEIGEKVDVMISNKNVHYIT